MKESIDRSKMNKTIRFIPFNLKHDFTKEDGTKDTALFKVSIKNGYPRFTSYLSNEKTEKVDYTKIITAPFDYMMLAVVLNEDFRTVINSDKPKIKKVDCLNVRWKDDVKTDEVYVQATVYFIKDAEGVVYISLLEDKKNKVKYKVYPNGYVRRYNDDGTPLETEGQISTAYAKEYLEHLLLILKQEFKIDSKYEQVSTVGSYITKPSNPDIETPNEVKRTDVVVKDNSEFDIDKMLDM